MAYSKCPGRLPSYVLRLIILSLADCSFPSITFQVLHEPRILLSKVHPSHIRHEKVCHQNTRNTTNRGYDECPSEQ